jgi:hypothetical protein
MLKYISSSSEFGRSPFSNAFFISDTASMIVWLAVNPNLSAIFLEET